MSLAIEFVAAITNIQGLNPCFQDPLDESALNEIETKTGLRLPEEFKNLYKLHNGQENSKWLPFANTADGHSICIDYDPDKCGNVGQIIAFWYNDGQRTMIADSFDDFLKSYLEKLKESEYIFDTESNAIMRKDGEPMFGA